MDEFNVYSTISIHALREEGDSGSFRMPYPTGTISIHALREEGDGTTSSTLWARFRFLSTPSVRRATRIVFSIFRLILFLSTPSVRRATLRKAVAVQQYYISIHALREEGDSFALLSTS